MRVSCTFEYLNREGVDTLWFEYSSEFDDYIDDSGDAWLVALLPIALLEREDLILETACDPLLVDNIIGVIRIWKSWYDWIPDIEVNCRTKANETVQQQRGAAVLFSGGVDSFFSLLRYIKLSEMYADIEEIFLTSVWGLDVPLDNQKGFSILRGIGQQVAVVYGNRLLEIATNIRDFEAYRFKGKHFAFLSHGAALAATGLLLQKKIKRIVIGSTADFQNLDPWGSHPLVDPLFSTFSTSVIHDGAAYTRLEKTSYVLNEEIVRSTLRVCWSQNGNCSRCGKCIRTMATIDSLGLADKVNSFDWSEYSLDRVSSVFLEKKEEDIYFEEICRHAIVNDRPDIANATRNAIEVSRKLRARKRFKVYRVGISAVEYTNRILLRLPLVWRIGIWISRKLPRRR